MRRVALVLAAMALALLLASGVALAVNKIGTDGPDTLRGTNRDDNLLGKGGQDDLFGLGGRDNLLGGPGEDWVLGGNERRPQGGDKNLLGGPGNDAVLGGNGSDNGVGGSGNDVVAGGESPDRVVGEEGKDLLQGGPGSDRVVGEGGTDLLIDGPLRDTSKDTLSGGDGDDIFIVNNRPATRDIVSCGSGFDRVKVDRKDVVAPDCEKEFTRFRELPPAVVEFFETFFEEQLAPPPGG
jgi:Ca2+-binding RTX toxin-like protein